MRFRRSNTTLLRSAIATLSFVAVASGGILTSGTSCRKYDELMDVNCEDLIARLDSYAGQLSNEPGAQAIVVVREGRYSKGRRPRHGEARANAARIKDYLVNARGVTSDRVVIVDGGNGEEFIVELYLCPRGETFPVSAPIARRPAIKFRKGKILKREYKWALCPG